MEQPTGSPGVGTDTWERLDATARPAAGPDVEVQRPAATGRLGAAVANLGGRLRSPAVTDRAAAADAVGRALERAGGYLGRTRVSGIRHDVERAVVRRPVVSVLAAVAVGYLAGRAVWR